MSIRVIGGIVAAEFLTALLAVSAAAQEPATGVNANQRSATLVILNGKVWTADPAHPRTEAVAIAGDRIAAVGTNDEIRKWIGPKTQTIDARGASVLPGFIDSHVHADSESTMETQRTQREPIRRG